MFMKELRGQDDRVYDGKVLRRAAFITWVEPQRGPGHTAARSSRGRAMGCDGGPPLGEGAGDFLTNRWDYSADAGRALAASCQVSAPLGELGGVLLIGGLAER